MAIRAVSLREYDRFNRARATMARHTDKAVEWFVDETGDVLGAIAYHQLNLEWSLVVLRRDHRGTFHVVNRDAGLRVLDDARCALVEKMATASAIGNQVPAFRAAWKQTAA